MKRAAITAFLTAAALALLPGSGAAAGPSRLQMSIVPADAQWVMHLDMERFVSSSIFKLLTESGRGFDILKKTAPFSEKFKMDPLKDIKGVTVFGRAGAGEEPVVAVSGSFNKDSLLGLLRTESSFKEAVYGNYTLYNWDGEHFGVFVNDSLALISENEADMKAALDALDGKAKDVSASPLVSLIKKGSGNAMIEFALADISRLTGRAKEVGAVQALPAMLTQMQSISGFVSETGDTLNLRIEIGAENDQVAQSIQQTIQGLVALMNLQFKEDAQPITRGMNVKTDGKQVRLDASYLVPELSKIINERKAKRAAPAPAADDKK